MKVGKKVNVENSDKSENKIRNKCPPILFVLRNKTIEAIQTTTNSVE